MTTTITAQEENLLRTHFQATRLGLAVFRPAAIFSGEATGTGAGSSGIILQAGHTGLGDMVKHFSIVAGSSPGMSNGGKVRYRRQDGANTITVSRNNVDWVTYPYLTGLRVIEPWAILPDLSNDLMDEDEAYDDVSNSLFHPLARIGPPALGYTNQAVNFWSASQVIASGASLTSHAWSFPNGSPSSSSSAGSAASPIAVTWSAATGHFPHYVKYTATDSNGRTHTRYNPVWIVDALGDLHIDVEVSVEQSWSNGYASLSLLVRDGGSFTEFPEDALICLFSEDHYGNTQQSIGGNWAHREQTLFTGYITSGSVKKNAFSGAVSFEALGIVGVAANLLNWPANLEDDGSPERWDRIAGMTCGKAAHHMLTKRTTIHHIADITYVDGPILKAVDIPETNVKAQISDYCLDANRKMVWVSDFQGMTYFQENINVKDITARDSIPETIELEFADMRDDPGLDLSAEDQFPAVAQVDFIGFNYDGVDPSPFYSLAPPNQYEHGDVKKVDGIRVDSQAESNAVAGLFVADFNNIFKEISIPLFNWRIFDISPSQYALLSLTGADNARGLVWSQQRLIPRQIRYEYDPDARRLDANLTFEKDTFGPPGIAGYYPAAPPAVPTPPPPIYEVIPLELASWDEVSGTFVRSSWREINGDLSGADTLDQMGDIDPWWFTELKQDSYFSAVMIAYKVVAGKVFKTVNGGGNWVNITPSARYGGLLPNDWLLGTPPVIANFDFIDFRGSIPVNDLFVMAANNSPAVDEYIGFVAFSTVGGRAGSTTWQWATLREWWLGKDLDSADVGFAHKAIAAADQASALDNLNNPGFDDAIENATVNWSRDNGWEFNGVSGYIESPIETALDGAFCLFIAYSDIGSTGWMGGVSESSVDLGVEVTSGTAFTIRKDELTYSVTGAASSGVVAICRLDTGEEAFYVDGVQVFTSSSAQTLGQNLRYYFGAANSGAGADNEFDGSIKAVCLVQAAMTDEQIIAMCYHMAGLLAG